MQKVKDTIGTFFGLSSIETEIVIQDLIRSYKPALLVIARILFVIGFICCLVTAPLSAIFIGILGYCLIQLEVKVDNLEKKIADRQQKY